MATTQGIPHPVVRDTGTASSGRDVIAAVADRTAVAEPVRGARSWAGFLLGFAALVGVLTGATSLVAVGPAGLAVLAAVLGAALLVERLTSRAPAAVALRRLGFGRPTARSLLGAAGVAGVVLLVHPLSAVVTGSTAPLRPGWPWLLVGVVVVHGIAEEVVWRGYAFRRLRQGRSVLAATAWTMPLIAAVHVPIVLTLGPVVGLGAMAVAAVTALPLAHLFQVGGGTLWAPALLHAAIDTFPLVDLSPASAPTFSLLLVGVALTVPLLALGVPPRRGGGRA